MDARPANPADPRTWWVQLVDAVAGLQRGDNEPAFTYLRFVDQHRGREAAKAAKPKLAQYRDSDAFRNCHLWPANDYRPLQRKRG